VRLHNLAIASPSQITTARHRASPFLGCRRRAPLLGRCVASFLISGTTSRTLSHPPLARRPLRTNVVCNQTAFFVPFPSWTRTRPACNSRRSRLRRARRVLTAQRAFLLSAPSGAPISPRLTAERFLDPPKGFSSNLLFVPPANSVIFCDQADPPRAFVSRCICHSLRIGCFSVARFWYLAFLLLLWFSPLLTRRGLWRSALFFYFFTCSSP